MYFIAQSPWLLLKCNTSTLIKPSMRLESNTESKIRTKQWAGLETFSKYLAKVRLCVTQEVLFLMLRPLPNCQFLGNFFHRPKAKDRMTQSKLLSKWKSLRYKTEEGFCKARTYITEAVIRGGHGDVTEQKVRPVKSKIKLFNVAVIVRVNQQ